MNQAVNSFLSRSKFWVSCAGLLMVLIAGLPTILYAQQDFRGLILENERYNQLPLHPSYGKFETLPVRFTNKKYFPKVVNQSTENNGVAWATTWYGMGSLYKRQFPSLGAMPSPAFTYRICSPYSRDCSAPISLIDALQSLSVSGAPNANMIGFFCADSLSRIVLDSARRQRLSGFARLFNSYDNKEIKAQSIKRAIALENPVVIGLICPPSFRFAGEFWQPREKSRDEDGGHAVTVVGYDDEKFGGAFEIVNSWGKTWGSEGYTWLRYDDLDDFVLYGFELLKLPDEVSGEVYFEDGNTDEMRVSLIRSGVYRFTKPYKTGSKFRMTTKTPATVFGVVIGIDPAAEAGYFFPSSPGVFPMITRELRLPQTSSFFELQGAPGKNTIVIAISSDSYALQQFRDRLDKEGPGMLAGPDNKISWNPAAIKFSANVPLVLIRIELIQE